MECKLINVSKRGLLCQSVSSHGIYPVLGEYSGYSARSAIGKFISSDSYYNDTSLTIILINYTVINLCCALLYPCVTFCCVEPIHRIKQGKSVGFDSCDRPSNLTQIGFKSSIFRLVWLWNLMDDIENSRAPLLNRLELQPQNAQFG